MDQDGPIAIRQLASVLLRQYVDAHWSSVSDKYRSPETPESVRNSYTVISFSNNRTQLNLRLRIVAFMRKICLLGNYLMLVQ